MPNLPNIAPSMPETGSTPLTKSSKKTAVIVLLVFLFIAISGLVFYYYKGIKTKDASTQISTSATLKPTPQPTPTPIPLKPDTGLQGTYSVSQGTHVGPTFKQVIFDPLDAQKGQTLSITVSFKDGDVVDGIAGSLQMDNSQANLSFQKLDSGIWQTKVNLTDSVLYKYILNLTAKNSSGSSTIKVAPRS